MPPKDAKTQPAVPAPFPSPEFVSDLAAILPAPQAAPVAPAVEAAPAAPPVEAVKPPKLVKPPKPPKPAPVASAPPPEVAVAAAAVAPPPLPPPVEAAPEQLAPKPRILTGWRVLQTFDYHACGMRNVAEQGRVLMAAHFDMAAMEAEIAARGLQVERVYAQG